MIDFEKVVADIENRQKRTLAAIERWLVVDGRRQLKVSFEVDGWLVVLMARSENAPEAGPVVIARDWHKPTLVDALAHAASYCQEEAP